jgi:hypothetical protein
MSKSVKLCIVPIIFFSSSCLGGNKINVLSEDKCWSSVSENDNVEGKGILYYSNVAAVVYGKKCPKNSFRISKKNPDIARIKKIYDNNYVNNGDIFGVEVKISFSGFVKKSDDGVLYITNFKIIKIDEDNIVPVSEMQ